jgi:putative endonuclease
MTQSKTNPVIASIANQSHRHCEHSEAILSLYPYNMQKQFFVYLLTNYKNTVIYTGVTSNLIKRVWEHKNKIHPNSFTAKYNVNKLVYYEVYQDSVSAITREKQIKAGSRNKKEELILSFNPDKKDLYSSILG